MIKQILIPLILVAAFITVVGLFVKKAINLPISLATPTPAAQAQSSKLVKIGSKIIYVDVANTLDLREKGLSNRATLGQNNGMLFVFDSKNVFVQFWMKDMLIPLDMIWISGGKIVKIDKNVPIPSSNTPDNALTVYSPNQPIDYVLEVNAGFCDKNSIQVGDNVDVSGAI